MIESMNQSMKVMATLVIGGGRTVLGHITQSETKVEMDTVAVPDRLKAFQPISSQITYKKLKLGGELKLQLKRWADEWEKVTKRRKAAKWLFYRKKKSQQRRR